MSSLEILKIDDSRIIKAIEVFTIMSMEGAIHTGKTLVLKGASLSHIGVLIFKTDKDIPSIKGSLSYESYCSGIKRPYWKAKKTIVLNLLDDGSIEYHSDLCDSIEKIFPDKQFPLFPIVYGKQQCVNIHKLKIKMNKNYVHNPKYPRSKIKYIPFNGIDFSSGPLHKTTTLYQCLEIAWRINKIGFITMSDGWTLIKAENPRIKYECVVKNFHE